MGDESLWTPQYYQRILQLNPIAYWMQDERQGTVAWDQVTLHGAATSRAGAYTGVDLGQPGIGDGRIAPYYDGTNDRTNVYSVSFRTAFNGSEGTVLLWLRAETAGVWTDGQTRRILYWAVDTDNRIYIQSDGANALVYVYEAGNVVESTNVLPANTTPGANWAHVGLTWSKTADQVRFYLNGNQTGATATVLGNWAGVFNANWCNLGSYDNTPLLVWLGNLAHCACWNYALSPTQVAALYRI